MKKKFALFGSWMAVATFAACENASNDSNGGLGLGDASVSLDSAAHDAMTQDGNVVLEASTDAAADVTDAGSADADAEIDAGADAAHSMGALSFDGIDDQVVFDMADGGPNETAFTLELWFKTTSTLACLGSIYGHSGGADRFIYTENGNLCFYVYGPPTTICTTGGHFNDDQWHHVAGTLGASGQQIYVDGQLGGTLGTVTKSTFTGGDRFRIGYGHYGFSSSLVYFQGLLDEVRLWSVERSATEIVDNYNHTIAADTPGLQGYWKLDDPSSSTTAADETSPGNPGTLTGFTPPPSPWAGPGAF